jgi:large subunit ribosomal protein L30
MAVKDDAQAPATAKTKKATSKTSKAVPKTPKSAEKQVKIRLVRSLIGRPPKQREVIKGLGLRRIDSEVVRKDCPEIRGMIRKVPHLVKVEELDTK